MKLLCLASSLLPLLLIPHVPRAQCGGTCPLGALTTLPSGTSVTIPAGTTYCIAASVVNKTTSYVIDGTLIVQGGHDSIGAVTLARTGVIDVEGDASLVVSGTFTGDATTPAPSITNVNVCGGGFLNIVGSFQQQEINMNIFPGGDLLVQGSWTTNASDVTVGIGAGALIEICGVVTVSKNGFLTEAGGGTSCLYQHTGGTYNGWISSLQNGSEIDWTSVAPSAFAQHPAARSCNGCGNLALAPAGADGNCGDAAIHFENIILPLQLLDFYEDVAGDSLRLTVDLAGSGAFAATAPAAASAAASATLLASSDGQHFAETSNTPMEHPAGHYVYSLPVKEATDYFQWKARTPGDSLLSWVLPPMTVDGGLLAYPNPASSVLYLRIPPGRMLTSATLTDNSGRLVRQITLPAQGGLMTLDLPAGLSRGIYEVTFRGNRVQPVALKVLINGH